MKYLKQIKIVNQDLYKSYLKDFEEEPLSFEDFVNFILGQLFDEQYAIESVNFIDVETVTIIYIKTI